jgi:hypothetical protein
MPSRNPPSSMVSHLARMARICLLSAFLALIIVSFLAWCSGYNRADAVIEAMAGTVVALALTALVEMAIARHAKAGKGASC